MKNISFFVLFTITIFLLVPLFAHASIVPCGQSVDDPNTNYFETDSCNLCHLFVGVSNVITFLTYDISLPASVIGFIIGGFFILTAAGSEERLKKGKNAVTFTVIGLLLVFGAWLIMDLILGNLVDPGYIPVWSAFPSAAQCSQTYNLNVNPGPQALAVCASFTYSNFGPCQPNGIQTRSVATASPPGCTGGNPVLSGQCNYTPPTSTVVTGGGTLPICSYTYSLWTPIPCTTGTQTRSVISATPPGCVGNPVLTKPCSTTPFQIVPNIFTIDQSNPAQFLIATFLDSNANESDVTTNVNWVSSNSNIAIVNANGVVSAGPQNGTAVITGTYTDPDTGQSYNKTVNVTVNTPRYSCINNQCAINQTNTNITQYSDFSACQQVCTQSQPTTGQPYVYITPEQYTLNSNSSYMACSSGGPCSSCTSSCYQSGESFQLNAYFKDANGNVTDVTNSSTWSSSNPALVYLLGPGQIIAGSQGANGFVWIKAIYNGYNNISEITVKP